MVLPHPHSFTGYLLMFLVLLMVLPHLHSFTGYILMFPRASYGLTSSPLLHRIYFKVFPCILWSYLIPTPSPDIFYGFPVHLMVLSHPHSFTGYLLMFPRASYGLTSSPLLLRISFNVSSCFLWSYLISTPSPDIF